MEPEILAQFKAHKGELPKSDTICGHETHCYPTFGGQVMAYILQAATKVFWAGLQRTNQSAHELVILEGDFKSRKAAEQAIEGAVLWGCRKTAATKQEQQLPPAIPVETTIVPAVAGAVTLNPVEELKSLQSEFVTLGSKALRVALRHGRATYDRAREVSRKRTER